MRITRDTLLKIARESVQTRVQRNRGIVCVYLTGSLLEDDPLIGGTADIDLFFIHDNAPLEKREIVRLTEDVHLDIAHFSQSVFHQPRHLRVHPWVGSYLCLNPIVLHDTHHWFEFTQASVCAQFNQPDYIHARVNTFAQQARQGWMALVGGGLADGDLALLLKYFDTLEAAANAVASFSGAPLPERRLLMHLAQRAQAINRPGLSAGMVDLLVDEEISTDDWQLLQPAWNSALEAAATLDNVPARLRPPRKGYYTRAAAALWEKLPVASIWLALRSWTLALSVLGEKAPQRDAWHALVELAGLSGQSFANRLDALDQYIDSLEEALDDWRSEYGLEPNI